MSGEESARSPIAHRERSPEPANRFTAAIDEVVWANAGTDLAWHGSLLVPGAPRSPAP
jgi:hypothetical protein